MNCDVITAAYWSLSWSAWAPAAMTASRARANVARQGPAADLMFVEPGQAGRPRPRRRHPTARVERITCHFWLATRSELRLVNTLVRFPVSPASLLGIG